MKTKIDIDIENYHGGLMKNNVTLCLAIERRYGLDGYPPNMVSVALQAMASGEDMNKALDDMMGFGDKKEGI